MKYKIGDVVRIKSWEELENTKGVTGGEQNKDLNFTTDKESEWFTDDMEHICETNITLKSNGGIGGTYDYGMKVDAYGISDWMIKEKVETTVDRVIAALYIPEPEEDSEDKGINITVTNNSPDCQVSTKETKTDGGREVEVIVEDAVNEALESGKYDRLVLDRYKLMPKFAEGGVVEDLPEVDSSEIVPLIPKKQKVTIEYEADEDVIDLTKWLIAFGFDVDVVGIGACFKIKACMEKEK